MKTGKALVLVLLLSPLWGVQAQTSSAGNDSDNEPIEYLDDQELQAEMGEGAAEIIEEESSISRSMVERLLSQLGQNKASVNTAPARTTPLPSAEVYEKVKQSTVIVGSAHQHDNGDTHVSASSGYVISEDGVCVTNFHVLESYAENPRNLSLQIRTADGKMYPVVGILAGSQKNDVAVIQVDTKGDTLTPLPLGEPPAVGSDIYVLSHPNRMFYYFSEGIVSRYYYHGHSHGDDNAEDRLQMAITADYARGSSGGPVVDRYGNLVGMVASTRSIYYNQNNQENLQMVVKNTVPVEALKELLAN